MSASEQEKYIVRFPDGMRDRIKDAARDNGRSMNAEIVSRLADSFERQELLLGSNKVMLFFEPITELVDRLEVDKAPFPQKMVDQIKMALEELGRLSVISAEAVENESSKQYWIAAQRNVLQQALIQHMNAQDSPPSPAED